MDNTQFSKYACDLIFGIRELNDTEYVAFTNDIKKTADIRDPACFTSTIKLMVYQLSCLYEVKATNKYAARMSDSGLRVRNKLEFIKSL